ncbi:MAG: alpha/beta hydrolase [Bacteroidetes bacterium]|nr:alpha/beta hydrolase [Bacteroidota bacterium]
MSHFISHKGFHWEYETYGSGSEVLLAFHGFGNHGSDFKVFEPSLGKKYTILSFNLPYHGNSFMDETVADKSISKETLKELFQHLFIQHHITRFSLMGYSLGGKIVLQLIQLFPEQVDAVFLFAPDGIRGNWSNGFVIGNRLGEKIYQRIIDDPSRFLRFVRVLKEMNMVHEKLSDFLHQSLETREKRQKVWDVWICFRHIKPGIQKIQEIINREKISLHLFFGKHDLIIPPSIGEQFVKNIDQEKCLHIVDTGHVMIREKMNDYLTKLFPW